MFPAHRTYLSLIKGELENTLIPASGSDFARLTGKIASRLISRLLLDETFLPAAREVAIANYRDLLPELRVLLPDHAYLPLEKALDLVTPANFDQLEAVLASTVCEMLGSSPEAARYARQIVAIDFRLRESVEAAFRAELASPGASNSETITVLNEDELVRLLDFIRRKFPMETDLRIVGVERLAGGFAKQTLFISFENNVELPASVVMRRDREFSASGTSVCAEFPLIKKLHELGVAVPQPFLLEESGEVLGSCFMLLARVRGHNIGDFIDVTEPSVEVALDYASALARLHTVPLEQFISLLKRGDQPTRDRVRAEIEEYERDWKALPFASFVMDCAYDWLKQNIHLAEGHRAVIHRDVGAHNMLVENHKVTALLDWERCATGNPVEDLGCIYYMVGQMANWDEFVTSYERAAKFTVAKDQLDFYVLWGSVRLTTLIAKAKLAVIRGQLKDMQLAYAGEHFVQRLLHRVSGKLTDILGKTV